jgi:flotillin
MSLQAMTSEKLKFSLPAVFTIGPEDKMESLTKYAVLLTGDSDGQVLQKGSKNSLGTGRNHVQEIVKGIIEGETRSIVSRMTMGELFDNRQMFKAEVIENVQSELNQFGLRIYNANVKELQDMPGQQYFEFLSKKAHEGAQNQAKVDVASARMVGEVGEAERQGETKQKIAKINAYTAVLETERKVEKAAADSRLKSREIDIERELNLERISAKRMAEQRDAELSKTVEVKKAEMELERQRAITVTKAVIDRESAQQAADASFYTASKKADGRKYTEFADADAALYKKAKEAEATLIARQNEAAGLMEMAKAYSQLGEALGGPQGVMQYVLVMSCTHSEDINTFRRYLMLQNNTFEKLAEANGRAIHGLQPKINVWNTGSNADGGADSTAPIRNLFQCLPPLFSTIQDQTGMAPPNWLAQMPGQAIGGQQNMVNGSNEVAELKKSKMVNGVGHG